MGVSVKIFFVEENDKLRPIPTKRFDRFFFETAHESFPEYANQKIKYVSVVVNNDNRIPERILKVDYCYLKFDAAGKLDQEFWDAERRAAVETISNVLFPKGFVLEGTSVIEASSIFTQDRKRKERTWKPGSELQKAIVEAIFPTKKPLRKKSHLKLV